MSHVINTTNIVFQAVEAAESAVAVVQGRLMEALRSKGDLVLEMNRMKREAEVNKGKLEMEVSKQPCKRWLAYVGLI